MDWMERKIEPMLARMAVPFDSEDFTFEWKLDGARVIAFVGKKTRLQNRRLVDTTYRYPELDLKRDVDAREAILDCEIVVLHEGKPDFKLLQSREHSADEFKIKLLSQTLPATLMVFDLLYLNGNPLVDKPLLERKEKLREVLSDSSRALYLRHVETHGKRFFEGVSKLGLEGMMAKRKLSTYQIGKRSEDWLKVKATKTIDCVIVGYTPGKGWRSQYFGALAVAAYRRGKLEYLGRVGTGWDEEFLKMLTPMLKKLETPKKPVAVEPSYEVHWVRPELVCEVEYLELTPHLHLRAPSFKRMRSDKPPEDAELPEPYLKVG